MFLYQTPGRRPPLVTGRVMKTLARGWVGAPIKRAPFRIREAVVVFVGPCLSQTQSRRFELNILLSLRPILVQHLARSSFFGLFCLKKNG